MDLIPVPLLAFALPLILNLACTPLIIRFADHFLLYDRLNHRKIHSGKISRLGGIGIFLAFSFTMALGLVFLVRLPANDIRVFLPLGGAVLVFGIGFWDDLYELRARIKLVVQIVAVLLVLAGGYWFASVGVPGFHAYIGLGVLGLVLTFGWILGVINAINLMDGMDGLAGGASFVVALSYGIIFSLTGREFQSILALALAGGIFGFLCYNRPKARIFMGDGGAYFLGFMLALIPLIDAAPRTAGQFPDAWFPDGRINVLHAITLLLIPISDTVAAILRRARKGQHFFEPDNFHMHHKMLAMGLSTWQILLVVCLLELVLAGATVFDILAGNAASVGCLVASWVLVLVFFIYLDRVQYRVKE